MKQFRYQTRPVVRGERCPATRSNKKFDPHVTDIRSDGRTAQTGKRACGRCGLVVTVRQSLRRGDGAPLNAWSYDTHTAPLLSGVANIEEK